MKERLATIFLWLAFLHAFINALLVVNFPIFIVVCSKCDMFENKSLYYRVTHAYFDFLATLPGEGLWLFFGVSPAIWFLLFVCTGSVRIVPWRHATKARRE